MKAEETGAMVTTSGQEQKGHDIRPGTKACAAMATTSSQEQQQGSDAAPSRSSMGVGGAEGMQRDTSKGSHGRLRLVPAPGARRGVPQADGMACAGTAAGGGGRPDDELAEPTREQGGRLGVASCSPQTEVQSWCAQEAGEAGQLVPPDEDELPDLTVDEEQVGG